MGLFAFGKGLLAEFIDGGDEGVDSFERRVGVACDREGPDPEKAFQSLLEGFVGIR